MYLSKVLAYVSLFQQSCPMLHQTLVKLLIGSLTCRMPSTDNDVAYRKLGAAQSKRIANDTFYSITIHCISNATRRNCQTKTRICRIICFDNHKKEAVPMFSTFPKHLVKLRFGQYPMCPGEIWHGVIVKLLVCAQKKMRNGCFKSCRAVTKSALITYVDLKHTTAYDPWRDDAQ